MDATKKQNPAGGRGFARADYEDSLSNRNTSTGRESGQQPPATPDDLIDAIFLVDRLAHLDWKEHPPLQKLRFELVDCCVTLNVLTANPRHFAEVGGWFADTLEVIARDIRREAIRVRGLPEARIQ